jgi:hypothetical protein
VSEIKPALTREEWAAKSITLDNGLRVALGHRGLKVVEEDGSFDWLGYQEHKIAALCLHHLNDSDQGGRGFTWEDVKRLRNLSDHLVSYPLKDLADRIEALLPPRG